MIKNALSKNELAELMYPIFAFENPLLLNRNTEYTISTIPLNIIQLIKSYLNMYIDGNNLDDINLIINIEEYFNNQDIWFDQFADNMSESFNKLENEYTIDFKNGYIDIVYKTDELDTLKKLNSKMLRQLISLRNWIISVKIKEKSLSDNKEFNQEQISVKPFILKR